MIGFVKSVQEAARRTGFTCDPKLEGGLVATGELEVGDSGIVCGIPLNNLSSLTLGRLSSGRGKARSDPKSI